MSATVDTELGSKFKIQRFITPDAAMQTFSIEEVAVRVRSELLEQGRLVKAVVDGETQQRCVAAKERIRTLLKNIEAVRKMKKQPLLDNIKAMDNTIADYVAPLAAEVDRLNGCNTVFVEAEEKRVQREERERQQRIAEQQAEAERRRAEAERAAAAVKGPRTMERAVEAQQQAEAAREAFVETVSAPPAQASRTAGMRVAKEHAYRVTDLVALFEAKPECCTLEAKASAVKLLCRPKEGATQAEPDRSVPGLESWWQTKVR